MILNDAIFNWLQIKIVSQARAHDRSAEDTVKFFAELLLEDHQVNELEYSKEEGIYIVEYYVDGSRSTLSFAQDSAEQLLKDIIAEPKYGS